MSEEIILRAAPGRDSTAAELARSRGEFRRRPHLGDDLEQPAPASRPASRTNRSRPQATSGAVKHGEMGRGRLLH